MRRDFAAFLFCDGAKRGNDRTVYDLTATNPFRAPRFVLRGMRELERVVWMLMLQRVIRREHPVLPVESDVGAQVLAHFTGSPFHHSFVGALSRRHDAPSLLTTLRRGRRWFVTVRMRHFASTCPACLFLNNRGSRLLRVQFPRQLVILLPALRLLGGHFRGTHRDHKLFWAAHDRQANDRLRPDRGKKIDEGALRFELHRFPVDGQDDVLRLSPRRIRRSPRQHRLHVEPLSRRGPGIVLQLVQKAEKAWCLAHRAGESGRADGRAQNRQGEPQTFASHCDHRHSHFDGSCVLKSATAYPPGEMAAWMHRSLMQTAYGPGSTSK